MLTALTAFAALTLAQATEPGIDFSGVQEPLGGEPTQVLVLGTSHLNQLPEGALNPGDRLRRQLCSTPRFTQRGFERLDGCCQIIDFRDVRSKLLVLVQ